MQTSHTFPAARGSSCMRRSYRCRGEWAIMHEQILMLIGYFMEVVDISDLHLVYPCERSIDRHIMCFRFGQ